MSVTPQSEEASHRRVCTPAKIGMARMEWSDQGRTLGAGYSGYSGGFGSWR